MNISIFYSWQSDLDSRYNRNFIETCIKKAVKRIKKNNEIKFEPVLDRDTKGKVGSPDIVNSIFDKIANSQIFVADVSIINKNSRKRLTSNPNVLIELGYAVGKLGWDNVILTCNEAYGKREELPFDLRGRRILSYNLNQEGSKKLSEDFFVQLLQDNFTSVLSRNNLFHEHFVARFFTYINNKILWIERMLLGIIRNACLNLGIEKPEYITYEELRGICKQINPSSFMLSYFNGRNYNSWYEYLSFISNICRDGIREILLFSNHLDLEFLGALSQVDSFLFTHIEQQLPPILNIPVLDQNDETTLDNFSLAIFYTCKYQRIAINSFFAKYRGFQKIALESFRTLNKDEKLRL